MTRTLQDQLAQISAPSQEALAPEKSWLRKMADRAGHPAGVRHAPEVVIDAFLGKLGDWYQTELRKTGEK